MADTSEVIRREIEEVRADLDVRLGQLASKAEHAVDVRSHLAERPWLTLATAVATGFLLGRGGRRSAIAPTNGAHAPRRAHVEMLVNAGAMALAGLVRDPLLREVRAWIRASRARSRVPAAREKQRDPAHE